MYQRILVPIDGSPTSNIGLEEALKLAKLTGAQLRLLHVVEESPFALGMGAYGALTENVFALLRAGGTQILADGKARAVESGVAADTVMFDSLNARLCDRVAEQAKTWKADLVVLGTHGRRGAGRLLLGSDAEQVARMAPTPVLLVRPPEVATG